MEGFIMKHWKLAGSTAVVALMSGSAVFADVTPEEVWQNWQDTSAAYGQTISATSAERDGDTLVVTGVKIAADQDGVVVDGTIDEINFTDNGDGTVEITLSDSYPIKIHTPATEGVEGSEPADLTITVSQPGFVITASGSVDATAYAFEGPSVGIKLEAINGVDASAVDVTAEATLTGVAGGYTVEGSGDAAKKLTSNFAAQSLALAIVGKDAEAGTDVHVTATVADIAGTSGGTFLGAEAMADLAAALKAGFTTDANFTYGKVAFDVDVTDAKGPTKIVGATEGGNFNVGLDATRLLYGAGGKGVTLMMSSPDIPFPEVKLSYAEAAFNLLIPVAKTEEPADFAFLTKIVDLSISEEIWGMIDPTSAFPHDPATVVLDTTGKVKLTTDLMDEAAMAALGEAPPGELHALNLNALQAKIAGAELTGNGALTFDNTDLTTFQGVPAPTGKIDLKLVGGNALLDKLVAMGLLTEDDANGARMMVSMFANSVAEDELTSTLEFKDKGFFANGMQLQ
jgi:hypothetical protein